MDKKQTFYQKYGKRFLDIIISLFAIIILSPLLLVLYMMVRAKLGSPAIFTQERPGKDEKIFKMYKFRSMTDDRDENGNLLPDDQRLTSFGRKLRASSLDELPELFNILKGDMSIVGPRPLLVEYLPFYKEEERMRHLLRPGLTGWAQINGRNATTWEEKFNKDIFYINNANFIFDFKVCILTINKVFNKSDILVGKEIFAGRLDDYRKNKEGKNV